MLHINTLTFPRRNKLHPYMKLVYLQISFSGAKESATIEGTLVQSFRTIRVPEFDNPGWLWFNISHLKASMTASELVVRRRTLHRESLTVNVTIHSIGTELNKLTISEPLDEKVLNLDEPPPFGYDIFNVSLILKQWEADIVGFQFQFTDDSGSLVIHDALTQSLYCLNTSSPNEPLLIAYRIPLSGTSKTENQPSRRDSQQCSRVRKRKSLVHGTTPGECSLHQWYVNLQGPELQHRILEPHGYYANICRGHCPTETSGQEKTEAQNPLWKTESQNTTISQIPRCVPQTYSSVNMIYIAESGDVSIESLKKMSIESCVCK
ncbi:uncharacterized LOC103177695 [Callorhinchus milii]|uniref:Bone morphogenetic protein 2/4 n=1 Tax=Callorhinchus milii TaxID=7868 RepID=K4FS82_CALMI|nr:uncharacterized LOC103177695 [Callorhinchus milii]AFK10510.1 bone morphogenetic protein 2/4 [Callorhinchus milii]